MHPVHRRSACLLLTVSTVVVLPCTFCFVGKEKRKRESAYNLFYYTRFQNKKGVLTLY